MNLGQYYGYRGKRVGHRSSTPGDNRYFDSRLLMTSASCMIACSKLVDANGATLCKYWIVHNQKGCLMFQTTKGEMMFKKKGFVHHGNCNGGTPLSKAWTCPTNETANDGCKKD